jgi:hypothetical protein
MVRISYVIFHLSAYVGNVYSHKQWICYLISPTSLVWITKLLPWHLVSTSIGTTLQHLFHSAHATSFENIVPRTEPPYTMRCELQRISANKYLWMALTFCPPCMQCLIRFTVLLPVIKKKKKIFYVHVRHRL